MWEMWKLEQDREVGGGGGGGKDIGGSFEICCV